jgi:hypothetical protein
MPVVIVRIIPFVFIIIVCIVVLSLNSQGIRL